MKAKRFAEGGEPEKSKTYEAEPAQRSTGLKRESFNDAFARARRTGEDTFEYDGKKYSTELKDRKASMDAGIPKKNRADEKVGAGYENVGKSEAKEDKRSRGVAAGLAGAGVGLGAAALLGGMRAAERARKENEEMKGKEERRMRSPVRNISPEEASWEGEGGRFRRGGKVKKMASGGMTSSASKRGDGIAMRGKTKGRMV